MRIWKLQIGMSVEAYYPADSEVQAVARAKVLVEAFGGGVAEAAQAHWNGKPVGWIITIGEYGEKPKYQPSIGGYLQAGGEAKASLENIKLGYDGMLSIPNQLGRLLEHPYPLKFEAEPLIKIGSNWQPISTVM